MKSPLNGYKPPLNNYKPPLNNYKPPLNNYKPPLNNYNIPKKPQYAQKHLEFQTLKTKNYPPPARAKTKCYPMQNKFITQLCNIL